MPHNKELKAFTLHDVAEHNNPSSAYIIIKDKVYDVTKFLSEHPGGDKVLLEVAGQDATASFNDVGHSASVWSIAEAYHVGYVTDPKSSVRAEVRKDASESCALSNLKEIIASPTWSNFLIPVTICIMVYAFYSSIKSLFL